MKSAGHLPSSARTLAWRCLALLLAASMAPTIPAADPRKVLALMDETAKSFRSLSGTIIKRSHVEVLNETTVESGTFRLRRSGKDLRMLLEFTKPSARAMSFQGREVRIFYPKLNTVQVYDLGKQRQLVDQFLLLGFGASGKDLTSGYRVNYVAQEDIAGIKAYHLELTPKSKELAEQISKIELWISPSDGQPVRQKFHQRGGDYVEIDYLATKLNPPLSAADLQLKTPPDVKIEYPQK